uniref:AB hydrolase-1 domain-containing protein n=1 Tax=Heterorhabditis bacteriophora TaxID=37862 RepID=A0A1I7XIS1_HETBA
MSSPMFIGLVQRSHLFLWRTMRQMHIVGEESILQDRKVVIENRNGERLSINAVYQDSQPSGSPIGTVVSLHGAPGSHSDFKYINHFLVEKGIRHIGVNYPGFGYTDGEYASKMLIGHAKLYYDNLERHAFVIALIEELDLGDKVVFMGHSRGTENAIMLAAERNAHGVVLLNPTGLSLHRALRPFFMLKILTGLYNMGPFTQSLLNPLYYKLYQKLGIKAKTGEIAAISMKTMEQLALHKQKPFIDRINQSKTNVLFFYSGRDWLIEEEISTKCAHAFDVEHIHCQGLSDEEDQLVTQQIKKVFQDGKRGMSVFFMKDGHFLQKDRARLIAEGISAMLCLSNKLPYSDESVINKL